MKKRFFIKSCLLGMFTGVSISASSADIQQSECFPATPEAKNWPICVVYLHGLFPPNGGNLFYEDLERKNRATLQLLASRIKGSPCRIAIPVSQQIYPSKKYGTNRAWQGTSLSSVEDAASRACGGAMLKKPTAILGFSNGGNEAVQLAQSNCIDIKDLSIFAFGPDGDRRTGRCGNLTNVNEHAFPSATTLETLLANIIGRPRPIPMANEAIQSPATR